MTPDNDNLSKQAQANGWAMWRLSDGTRLMVRRAVRGDGLAVQWADSDAWFVSADSELTAAYIDLNAVGAMASPVAPE